MAQRSLTRLNSLSNDGPRRVTFCFTLHTQWPGSGPDLRCLLRQYRRFHDRPRRRTSPHTDGGNVPPRPHRPPDPDHAFSRRCSWLAVRPDLVKAMVAIKPSRPPFQGAPLQKVSSLECTVSQISHSYMAYQLTGWIVADGRQEHIAANTSCNRSQHRPARHSSAGGDWRQARMLRMTASRCGSRTPEAYRQRGREWTPAVSRIKESECH